MPFGLLNLNKPAGLTSRDAVNRVQRVLKSLGKAADAKPAKVGHAGTLDPIATGVLVLCVGSATKLIEHVQRMPKRYRGTFLLGRRSASDDTELEVTGLPDAPRPTLGQIEAALPAFLGEIQQVPPAYSAIKVGGRKSYDMARAGNPPELPPRPVTIYELSVERYEYPELVLNLHCGSGTYVRSIGRDVARALGTAAVMSALERTEIGPFTVADGIEPDAATETTLSDLLQPATLAVAGLPRVQVNAAEVEELRNGRFIARGDEPLADEVAAVDEAGRLVALLKPRGTERYQPVRNFA
ncbi:MAG: tRNA pseudouridine(55) synthase TruB [Planctomycetota bacterium]